MTSDRQRATCWPAAALMASSPRTSRRTLQGCVQTPAAAATASCPLPHDLGRRPCVADKGLRPFASIGLRMAGLMTGRAAALEVLPGVAVVARGAAGACTAAGGGHAAGAACLCSCRGRFDGDDVGAAGRFEGGSWSGLLEAGGGRGSGAAACARPYLPAATPLPLAPPAPPLRVRIIRVPAAGASSPESDSF